MPYHGTVNEQERSKQRYALEKLYLAICTLVGSRDVRERLVIAYISHLHPLTPNDFPGDLAEAYRGIREALSWLPPEYEGQGRLQATINAMTQEEAELLAQRLVTLYGDLLEQYHATTE
jgi:hypothetical protein